MVNNNIEYDALVIGGGIAGQEASLNLANNGFKVLLVEKDLSLGGKMIQLSKVFPTLDCAACIATPKISETARNPNITIMTYSEVKDIEKLGNVFKAKVIKYPRYVKEDLCSGCQECEKVCPVNIDDQYNYNLVGRKAVYIPFNLANPRIATIDINNCILCGACEKVCPADAIDFTQKKSEYFLTVKTIIIATGFNLFEPWKKKEYNYNSCKNIIHSMEMERLLAPTRPFNYVLRPLDGKKPDNIAYVLCTGSRDKSVGNPICSQICCMYSIKQAQLLMGAIPTADITIYYIDIRAFGKGFDEFYEQAKEMDVTFIKGKVAKITEKKDGSGNLLLRYEAIDENCEIKEAEHDLVVLSVGILPNPEISSSFKNEKLELDEYNYLLQVEKLTSPAKTNIKGVFVAGTASGPMDIPDSILSAGDASAEATSYLRRPCTC
ncbi:MAG: CoB--CoM heterodisulfide reductase iron-sulfur subunit A family protein [Bacteroidales bacterium]|nr:CoB--CoM heterodisulfide reductase iron-sulfur subunit A family protein [Bacteroidales bacterium]